MELPRRYGHYVLLERIAVGGMGEIFQAKYAGLAGFERICAIKRILPHLSDDPEFVDRLISEAMIAVQLSHAGIVQVYELGKVENEYFIAMEWVDGPDLSTLQIRAKARDIPLPLPLAIHVVREIARAVDYAHRKTDSAGKDLQIVHRDISPQNVMLTVDGAVKLGDFGIARAGNIARRFATGTGAVLGKRRYMSPEQRRGESVDARTDVYSLGALLFECVTGQPPEPDAVIPPMSASTKDIPPELDAVAARALAADPLQRTQTSAELADGLERVFLRMASAPGATRDPGPELGRYVRKVCPPGEKLPQKRSLTERIRAAMRPGVINDAPDALTDTPLAAGPAAEATGTAEVPRGAAALTGGADGVTIVGSAIISGARTLPRTPPAGRRLSVPPVVPANATPHDGSLAAGAVTTVQSPPSEDDDATVLEARALSVPPARALPSPVREIRRREAEGPTKRESMSEPKASEERGARREAEGPTKRESMSEPKASEERGARREAEGPTKRESMSEPKASEERGARREAEGPTKRESTSDPASGLFPQARARALSIPAILAVGAAFLVVLGVAWRAGFFGPSSPQTPVVERLPPVPRVTRSPRRPDRTPTPLPRGSPERTRATPAATKTPRLAVAGTPLPTATPASRPQESGVLVVNAKPWAQVSVDGKDQGQTPIKGLKLSAGSHRVVLEHPKHGRFEKVVIIENGAVGRVIHDFTNPAAEPGPGSP